MHQNPTFAVCTLGCRVNQYESQAISEGLIALGYVLSDFSLPCDLYIVNTCAVTQESSRKSRQMINRAHRLAPEAAIFVTGCEAQRMQKDLATDGVVRRNVLFRIYLPCRENIYFRWSQTVRISGVLFPAKRTNLFQGTLCAGLCL